MKKNKGNKNKNPAEKNKKSLQEEGSKKDTLSQEAAESKNTPSKSDPETKPPRKEKKVQSTLNEERSVPSLQHDSKKDTSSQGAAESKNTSSKKDPETKTPQKGKKVEHTPSKEKLVPINTKKLEIPTQVFESKHFIKQQQQAEKMKDTIQVKESVEKEKTEKASLDTQQEQQAEETKDKIQVKETAKKEKTKKASVDAPQQQQAEQTKDTIQVKKTPEKKVRFYVEEQQQVEQTKDTIQVKKTAKKEKTKRTKPYAQPQSEYVNLYSKDKFLFIIKRDMAYVSEPLKKTLTEPELVNTATFPDVASDVVFEVCNYFYYKVHFDKADQENPPPFKFKFTPNALHILAVAADLEC